MKVYVVFDFPEISDINSQEADYVIDLLEIDLKNTFGKESTRLSGDPYSECSWHIDDAEGGV
jgi:hypothetical protein